MLLSQLLRPPAVLESNGPIFLYLEYKRHEKRTLSFVASEQSRCSFYLSFSLSIARYQSHLTNNTLSQINSQPLHVRYDKDDTLSKCVDKSIEELL